ncbi:ATP synthase F1 subunit delta [Christiangramia forsetii]|uniref:ATP synthase subunit delta n=2 Tax=Christiangramia forsetii TaxID=411153 RepID=ATPD_CHRFK|nr:ATP synthase F1 subunit delta [Christiangramia forsetii]A0M6G5.1 RecName: Full=ATP synthase subunit delta; AltName: Full=ATP synthase F(1) sector subunit delta; AltName: Full=F-type ATPase subunit delta; Short=F-ATPase subunit delta [Christiangramia forsetii KT0803]GGG30474.1 ATP synthase subunit delta [Christiangramia forsetii]CAL68210.1 ATP synthase subunit delta (OSCP) [Christiangramia forsetii KT0803]
MRGTRAAQRYAKAILSLAKDKNSAEAVNEDMISISKTVVNSRDLENMLTSPVIKDSTKKSALLEIFKDLNTITKGAIDILLENGRIGILHLVARQYIIKFNELNNVRQAVVTTAVPLDKELEAVILSKVKELTGSEASLKSVIDEDIIGGFVLRVGDLQYDASVSRNLRRLERELKDNTYVSKI